MSFTVKRALIIKLGAIGDAIMALPLARELKARGCQEITWLAGKDIESIVALAPEIDRRVILDERALFGGSKIAAVREILRTWNQLRGIEADAVYLLHADRRYRLLVPPRLRSKIVAMRVGSRRHHTFDYARLAYPDREDRELSFEPYTRPELPAGERLPRICLFPGGAKNAMRDDPQRRWPLENYVVLCEALLSQGHTLSIVGGPSDHWIETAFAQIRSKLDWQVGTMQLPETVEFIRRSKLAVTHDTGPLHLSSLADTPVVSIFGPTPSDGMGPLRYKHLIVERSLKLPCQPCYDGRGYAPCARNICIADLGADIVMQKISLALRSQELDQ